MRLRILGSAAGGRFPQWNCGCANCVAVRASSRDVAHENAQSSVPQPAFHSNSRTQAQLALSSDGSRWFLAGASPDLAFQIEATSDLHPRALRDSPIAGVVLSSADLDHVVGLLLLRELQPLRVYAAPSILRILREENSMFGMLNRVDPQVTWTPLAAPATFPLLDAAGNDSGLCCAAVFLSGRYPKYVKSSGLAHEASAALFFEGQSSNAAAKARIAYVPAVERLDDALLAQIEGADALLLDGTFWSDDELIRIQGGGETAHQMGHIPVEESLRLLKNVKVGRRIYTHINNTNPILDQSSPEYRAVRDAGWEVAEDNWYLEL
ncbi:MAG: MBL fold metallo-hydrolase [Terriglobales bacterium]|jgi:pyrroloquinoline quinone biosynthesis protein B